jgi:hypothetical protein
LHRSTDARADADLAIHLSAAYHGGVDGQAGSYFRAQSHASASNAHIYVQAHAQPYAAPFHRHADAPATHADHHTAPTDAYTHTSARR